MYLGFVPFCFNVNNIIHIQVWYVLQSLNNQERFHFPCSLFMFIYNSLEGARGSLVVKALGYKPGGRGFETHRGEILNSPDPSGRTRPWGSLSL
jgi:hypothetical protein